MACLFKATLVQFSPTDSTQVNTHIIWPQLKPKHSQQDKHKLTHHNEGTRRTFALNAVTLRQSSSGVCLGGWTWLGKCWKLTRPFLWTWCWSHIWKSQTRAQYPDLLQLCSFLLRQNSCWYSPVVPENPPHRPRWWEKCLSPSLNRFSELSTQTTVHCIFTLQTRRAKFVILHHPMLVGVCFASGIALCLWYCCISIPHCISYKETLCLFGGTGPLQYSFISEIWPWILCS